MTSFTLKIIALITMLCDHIGFAISSDIPDLLYYSMRGVGRIAMPLFCFMIAEGLFHTKDAKKYLMRLFVFAVASEIPFDLCFFGSVWDTTMQNVGFTLFFGLLGIFLFDMFSATNDKSLALLAFLTVGFLAIIARTDYNFFGVYYILIFYLFRKKPKALAAAFCVGEVLSIVSTIIEQGSVGVSNLINFAAIISLVFILSYNGEKGGKNTKIEKNLFYIFYPAHLLIIGLLEWLYRF